MVKVLLFDDVEERGRSDGVRSLWRLLCKGFTKKGCTILRGMDMFVEFLVVDCFSLQMQY